MKRILTFGLMMIGLLAGIPSAQAADATNLRCEYLANPLGIDVMKPRLSWVIEERGQGTGDGRRGTGDRGQRQTAYQVLVASSEALLKKDQGDLWDSGKVVSEQSILVEYTGKPPVSCQQCFWKVRVWMANSEPRTLNPFSSLPAWSKPASWTMGLLKPEDWQAKWIGAATNKYESLLLRRDFAVKSGLRRAVVAVCGLGHYELTLNGKKVSEDVLAPGWTKYNKTCLYDMYDVTESLRPGNNALGLFLGNGMYNVKGGRYAKFTGSFGPQKAIAQLRLEFEDGTSETVVTDGQWRVHSGPVTFTCVYGGEDYDARLSHAGWDKPGFTDATWEPAVVMQGPGGALKGLSCAAPPVRCFDTFKPVKTTVIRPGVTVYDFGQNAAQMPRITVSGPRGGAVKLSPAEIVGQDNSINQGSVGGNISCSYWLDGSGRETWSPRFFYCGYRYLQVECIAAPQGGALPVVEALESRVVHTSSTPIGEFSTSNELINRIYKMIRWAQRSNMVSVMTDCPHREKLGWLEQTHLNGPALRYNYDLNAFFSKLMNDMADSQIDNGMVPDTAPEYPVFGGGFRDSPEWGSAFPQVAWHQYQTAGDIELLRRYYDGMARYVAYLEKKAGGGRMLTDGLGDWRQLENTPNAVTATTIFYDDARILAKMAELLGKTEDAARYGKLASEIRDAFNKQFFNAAATQYAAGTQTANAIPLDMGMVPEENRAEVLGSLVKRLQADGLKAGEIGFPYLLRALANGGRSDVIFAMINQTDKPGYGFQLNYGATSLPEDWDYQPSNSQNHFMLGHINEWFYHDLAGIQCDPAAVGFKKIIIKPVPVGDLTWVKAHYDSLYGRIVSNWKLETGNLKLDVTIPINTTATVYVPAKDADGVTESGKPAAKAAGIKFLRMENRAAVYEVGSGTYRFQSTLP
ncbi:MAG: glycoside hydrolase family 78 protein [bacterium]